jgi:hypothetical protein
MIADPVQNSSANRRPPVARLLTVTCRRAGAIISVEAHVAKRIYRVGLYFYPPEPLADLLRRVWRGEFNDDLGCELVCRHAGECPLWDAHGTLLDAITIIEEDRSSFVAAMSHVLQAWKPLSLSHPDIKEWGWGDNVFLRWDDDPQRKELKRLREEISDAASEFAVLERLDWERVNELDRIVSALRLDKDLRDQVVRPAGANAPLPLFTEGVHRLKGMLQSGWPDFPYAPNIPLEWYVSTLLRAGKLTPGELPFNLSPHISVASGIRDDEKYGWPAAKVSAYIKENLKLNPAFAPLLGPGVSHPITEAYIVEPVEPAKAIEVTVVDRITKGPRREFRQPWVRRERLGFDQPTSARPAGPNTPRLSIT